MLPLMIKGFLPQQNGSTIMLPEDVTQIAGSDFDIDKLFLMIPEFEYSKQIDRKALENAIMSNAGFRKWGIDKVRMTIDMIINGKIMFDDNSPEEHIYDFYSDHKDEFLKDVIRKVRYNHDKGVEGNNRKQRNNAIIDIAYAILTHKSSAEKINNPGSFDRAKLAARKATISNDMELFDSFMENVAGHDNATETADILLNTGLDDLNDFLNDYKKERNPLSVDTFIYNHKQNMTGGILIGIYANNTTMQAKYQTTRLALSEKNAFWVNGRKVQSLHAMQTQIGNVTEWISKNCAEFSAASVDNVKDPVLADLLQNKDTAKIAGFMLRAGMSIEEVGLFFTQPLVRECIDTFGNADVKNLSTVIDAYTERLKELKGGVSLNKEQILQLNFSSSDLMKNIILFNKARQTKSKQSFEGMDIRDILAMNIQSAALFAHISGMANVVGDMTQISRGDSPNGALKNSIALAKNQAHKVDKFIYQSKDKDFPLIGVEDIMRNGYVTPDMSVNEMRDRFMDAAMPVLQAFHSLGIDFGQQLTAKYFAQLNPYVNALVEELYRNSKWDSLSDDILETFYRDLVTFSLSKSTTFGDDSTDSYDKKRDYYLYDYPREFAEIMSDPKMKYITNLGALRKMKVEDGKIIMERSGRITTYMRDMLMRDFDSLLYGDEKSRKLAVDLFMYAYYKDGFYFGPNSFGNFFSTVFITSFPEVTSCLRNMSFNITKESYFNRFLEQFYANHLADCNLPTFKSGPTTGVNHLANGNVRIKRGRATNENRPGSLLYKYIVVDGDLYQSDIHNSNEQYAIYMPAKTHVNPLTGIVKYNANMTAQEMAEIPLDEARIEASKNLSLEKKSLELNEERQSVTERKFNLPDMDVTDDIEDIDTPKSKLERLRNMDIDDSDLTSQEMDRLGDKDYEGFEDLEDNPLQVGIERLNRAAKRNGEDKIDSYFTEEESKESNEPKLPNDYLSSEGLAAMDEQPC